MGAEVPLGAGGLFDLESDPDELVNLAGEPEYGAILEAQRALCDALRAR